MKRSPKPKKAPPSRRAAKQTVGRKIVERVKEFHDAVMRGDAIDVRFVAARQAMPSPPNEYAAEDVRQARALLGMSQAVFAAFLGVGVKAVQAWEQGVGSPNGSARRLMDEIRHQPDYWKQRLAASAEVKAG